MDLNHFVMPAYEIMLTDVLDVVVHLLKTRAVFLHLLAQSGAE